LDRSLADNLPVRRERSDYMGLAQLTERGGEYTRHRSRDDDAHDPYTVHPPYSAARYTVRAIQCTRHTVHPPHSAPASQCSRRHSAPATQCGRYTVQPTQCGRYTEQAGYTVERYSTQSGVETSSCARHTVCGADTYTVEIRVCAVRTGNRTGDITSANAPEKPRPIKALAVETRRIAKRTHSGPGCRFASILEQIEQHTHRGPVRALF